jgi:hypothetical protein
MARKGVTVKGGARAKDLERLKKHVVRVRKIRENFAALLEDMDEILAVYAVFQTEATQWRMEASICMKHLSKLVDKEGEILEMRDH